MSNSPWGTIQSQIVLARGVRWVNTASHGGFLISQRFANLYFSPAAVKCGRVWGNYLAFEEDCDATIILFETRAFDDALGYTRNYDVERLQSLSRWHADYLIERGITPDPEGLAWFEANRKADALRAAKSPDLIISATGSIAKWVPEGRVGVITADGKYWTVPASEYAPKTLNLLSTYTDVQAVQS